MSVGNVDKNQFIGYLALLVLVVIYVQTKHCYCRVFATNDVNNVSWEHRPVKQLANNNNITTNNNYPSILTAKGGRGLLISSTANKM